MSLSMRVGLGQFNVELAARIRLLALALHSSSEEEAAAREVEAQVAAGGRCGFQFIPRFYYLGGQTEPWDDGAMRPFWRALAALGIPVYFTLGMGRSKGRDRSEDHEGYLNEHSILQRWMDRYPDAVCSITHGFPYRSFLEGGKIRLPDSIWEPFDNPNLSIEVCFPVRIGDIFDFPYDEARPTLEEMVSRIGADRLMWGTDMPFQNRHCTYRQSRDWIEKYCNFLTPDDLANIMGGTAARILRI